MVSLVRHDLDFILKQIKIAEAHSGGMPLGEIYVDANGNVVPAGTEGAVLAISDPLAPYGLRTVNGSFNNLSGDRDDWGSADNPFVQITDPYWRDEDDDAMPFPGYVGPDADLPLGLNDQNNDYGDHTATNGSPMVKPGTVVDADPRIISNLIVDQTLDNPAAIYAALMHSGYSGAELNTALNAIVQAKAALDAAIAAVESPAEIAELQAAVTAAQTALDEANAGAAIVIAQAATDQTALTDAQTALSEAQADAAAAIAAVTALLTDGTPNSQQQEAFDAAIALSDEMQAAVQTAQANFNTAQTTANGSAAAVAAATGGAAAALAAAQQALAEAQATGPEVADAQADLNVLLDAHGIEMDGNTVRIPNVSPDEGLSAPYNSWFTLFGQFFDHGLDLVAKNGGTVYIPLQPDDPLYDHTPGARTNFMVVTRTNTDADNVTTPWVDQNQTYGSTASKQLFMREYDMDGGRPVSTGSLLEGERGLATWGDIKKQALEKLGFELTDLDVGNIPLFAMDAYGEFIPGPLHGLPQIIAGYRPDGSAILVEGDLENPINPSAIDLPDGTELKGSGTNVTVIEPGQTVQAVRTDHAFLDDIAHSAKMVNDRGQALIADQDDAIGITTVVNPYYNATHTGPATHLLESTQYVVANPGYIAGTPSSSTNKEFLAPSAFWDNELLDAHYITGDGRGNENIGLSAVHHIFHSEHNRLVEQVKELALTSGDLAFLNEWLREDVTAIPTTQAGINALKWDGERLFQAARFTNEMEYQHLVFEEFARKVQPDVDAFVFNPSLDIDPAIFAEFAHVVYRFGHSMLAETVDIVNADGSRSDMTLFSAFLNPLAFGSETIDHDVAAGAIVRGMTAQAGNEIDEFVTHVLRNQLVGIPLDLAAINIARGRETGIPPLNQARREFKEIANGDTQLDPYTSWTDFALNLKNPASIVNFIAAYGTHASITSATTAEQKREAAMLLVFGDGDDTDGVTIRGITYNDRLAFLNATGPYAGGKLGGLEDVDLWVGGLAEKKMAFGGMLGSTFSFVFELQLENLQNADRFYYLSRVQGLNLLNELENNSLAKMVLNNTDLGETGYAVPGDIFSTPDHVIYVDADMQAMFGHADPVQEDPTLQALSPMVERRDSAGNLIEYEKNADGTFKRDTGGNVIPIDPAHGSVANYIKVNTNDHVLIQGTNGNDHIVAGGGDDSVWGMDGNDRIEAGYGVDKIHGGKGDDIITNSGTDIGEVDMLHGEEGNDVIHGGSGLALIFGNQGQDFIITGPDGKEAFGGTGNDFILGGEGGDFLLGNEGDDWIEAGNGFDTTAGDNSELFFNSTIIGHDVMFAGQNEHDFDAESGDDIMVQGESVMRNEGMWGFDWAIHKGSNEAADADLNRPIFTTDQQDILRNRYDQVEGLSGWNHNDVLKGDDRGTAVDGEGGEVEGTPGLAGAEGTMAKQELTQAGVDRIDGMRELLGTWVSAPTAGDRETQIAFDDGNILLGGGGADVIEGRGGNDVIDGDSWLNVRIRIDANNQVYSAESMAGKVYLASDFVEGVLKSNAVAQFGGKTLDVLMLERALIPGHLSIVREIVKDDGVGDKDVAVFSGNRDEYTITRDTDGSLLVSHTGFDPDNVPDGANLVSDGTDKLWNIEILRFADGDVELTPPDLYLRGPTTGTYADNFNSANWGNSSGSVAWGPDWVESGDSGGITSGQIRIDEGNFFTTNVMQFVGGNTSDGATITRDVDLSGRTSATIRYSANPDNLGQGEFVRVEFAADGATFVLLNEITGSGGNTSYEHVLNGPFASNAKIRFVGSAMNNTQDVVTIDGLSIEFPTSAPVVNYETTYTEGGADQDIAVNPVIVEDSGEIVSARIVLTNAQAGDDFDIPFNLPGDIDSEVDRSVAGRITIDLTGTGTIAQWQSALQQIEFINESQNPSTVDRTIEVTVNDGFMDSNVATTTVNVTAVDDDVVANNDNIITNISGTTSIVVPKWALMLNDSDPDSTISITAVGNANGLSNLTHNATSVTFTDPITGGQGGGGGSFGYTATGAPGDTDGATVSVTRDTGDVAGDGGNNILIGGDTGTSFDAGTGDDIVLAGGGNDTIVWNANNNGNTDGRDIVDGGAGTDTFDVNTRPGAPETYGVYTLAEALSANLTVRGPSTEIVITRNGVVIAELDNVEEIRVGTQTTDPVAGPAGQGDTVQIFGDFSTTSLALNTITIEGDAGDDTVDISQLTSAHRIVFRSRGGNDTIVGTLRPQDVIELEPGRKADEYEWEDNEDGSTTVTRGDHKITFRCEGGRPELTEVSENPTKPQEPVDPQQPTDPVDPVDPGPVTPVEQIPPTDPGPASPANLVLRGNGRSETLRGDDGNDRMDGGRGHDKLYGEAGNDRLRGGEGHDRLDGGTGNDRMEGGRGNDVYIVDSAGDRVIERSGQGIDTVKSSVSFSLNGTHVEKLVLTGTTDLNGTGNRLDNSLMGNAGDNLLRAGSGDDVLKGMAGNDRLHGGSGEDRLLGGSGDDLLKGGAGNDRLTGGSGQDTFVFERRGGADTVTDFRSGQDKIDARGLSGVDSLSDLTLVQDNQDVMIARGSNILVLKGVNVSDLDNSDFIF